MRGTLAATRAAALATALIILSGTSSSIAHGQTVVGELPATDGAWGLDYHDGFLWMGDDRDGFIYKVDPADGSILDTLPTPYDENHIANGANHGVAWDGSGFWVAGDFNKDWLYKVDINGAFLDTIPTPTDAVGGLGFDGTYLLVTSYYPNDEAGVLKVDPADGTIVGPTIPTQGEQPFGIVYDGSDGTLWNGMDDNDGDAEKIYNLDYSDGSVLSSFDTPATSPKGIALGGGYMWVVANTIGGSGRKIYQIDLTGTGTPDIVPIPVEQEFGIVAIGTGGQRTQILRNLGDGDLIITDISTFSPFSFDMPTLPATLAPNEQISFDVYFDPLTAGNFQTNLTVISNDFDEGSLDISMHGIGVPQDPSINISPPSLAFADTGTDLVRARTFSIQNVGFEDLVLSDVASDSDFFAVPEGLLDRMTLGTFETLDVQVLFSPIAPGSFGGTIAVDSNDPDDPTELVPVSGDGIDALFAPGEAIWSAQGIENVVSVLAAPDLTGNGRPDAIAESYDAGADGDPARAYHGNSHGAGVPIWTTGEGTSGGWGDQCLAGGMDIDGDLDPDYVRGTAWGGRSVEVRDAKTGELSWSFDTSIHNGGGWVYSVATLPDVSGDGLPEVLAAAGTNGDPGTGARRIYCFDGATGAIRFAHVGPDGFLSVAAIEDVNGDTVPDVIGGAGGNSADDRVVCLSGAGAGNGTLIWDFNTGGSVWSVAVIEDVNDDGIDDVIAGSWSNTVYCLDGTNGDQIWQAPIGNDVLSVVALDDVTGDGIQDVAVAQIGFFFRVLDGADGSAHWFQATGDNVWSVDAIPDVDGDDVNDVIAGSQDDKVYCVSGASGDLLWTTDVGALVFSVRSIGDVNGNGTPDVIAGTQYLDAAGGKIWCLEGSGVVVAIDELETDGFDPAALRLAGFSPNPMRQNGSFLFHAGSGGVAGAGNVGIDIFDLSGRRVRTLETTVVPGRNELNWDGRSHQGFELPSGVYYYRATGLADDQPDGRIVLVR